MDFRNTDDVTFRVVYPICKSSQLSPQPQVFPASSHQLLGTSVVSPEAGAWSGCTCSGGHPKAIVSDLEKSILSLNSCAGNSVVMVSPWQVMLILLGWWSFKFPF